MSVETGPAPAAAAPARARPSRAWYWVAGIVAFLGLVTAAVWAVSIFLTVRDHVEDFARAPIPGQVTVSVTNPGEVLVYYEGDEDLSWRQLALEVTGPNGAAVPLERYGLDLQYDFFGRTGKAVASFDADTVGQYRVSASQSPEADAELAVGETYGREVVGWVLGALVVALLAVMAACAIAAVTFVRRSRAST